MGLRSPFGYVGYEIKMGQLFIGCLDKLCSHCHTNRDYRKGCLECPAGNLIFECKEYIESYDESDKRFKLYGSKKWAKRSNKPIDTKSLEMAQDYKPECDVLRKMKIKMKKIVPHPFFYVQDKDNKLYRRPKVLVEFTSLLDEYIELHQQRMAKWGFSEV